MACRLWMMFQHVIYENIGLNCTNIASSWEYGGRSKTTAVSKADVNEASFPPTPGVHEIMVHSVDHTVFCCNTFLQAEIIKFFSICFKYLHVTILHNTISFI